MPKSVLAVFAIVIALPAAAQTDEKALQLASDLGISPSQLQTCMAPIQETGGTPSRSDRVALRNCLVTANPSLTNGQIRSAFQAFSS